MGKTMILTGYIAPAVYELQNVDLTNYNDVTTDFLNTYGITSGYWTETNNNRTTSGTTAARFNSINFVTYNENDEYIILVPESYISNFRLCYAETSTWSSGTGVRFRTGDFINNAVIDPKYIKQYINTKSKIWAFNIGISSGSFNLQSALDAGFKIYKKN